MSLHSQRTILAGTDEGLHLFNGEGAARVDDLAGREVRALAAGPDGWWAIVEGREVWRSAEGHSWTPVATVARRKPTCLAAAPRGLLVGTARAHLLRLERDRLVPVPSFDEAEGRDEWYTPWGAPADVRAISAGAEGEVYVNVHVGGVVRSTDGGATWRPTLDIEHDVHQVLARPARPGLVTPGDGTRLGSTRTTVVPSPSPTTPCSSAPRPVIGVAARQSTDAGSTVVSASSPAGSGSPSGSPTTWTRGVSPPGVGRSSSVPRTGAFFCPPTRASIGPRSRRG